MDNKKRIIEMEKIYQLAERDSERIDDILNELDEILERLNILSDYYENFYMEDVDWERKNPISLEESTTGLLSQDGIFNLLVKESGLTVRLLEMLLKINKRY